MERRQKQLYRQNDRNIWKGLPSHQAAMQSEEAEKWKNWRPG